MHTQETGRARNHTNTQDLDWSEERADKQHKYQNIGDGQRLLSAIAGSGLLLEGWQRRSMLGSLLTIAGVGLLYRAASGYCPAFGAVGINMRDAQETNRLGRRKVETATSTKIRQTIEINRPPHELYRFWRSLENLPRVMTHLQSVQTINDRLSHWAVKTFGRAPAVEWDAEIINDVENERIGWRSLYGSDVDNAGSVEFEPSGDGQRTMLTVTLQYTPPAGRLGTSIAKLIGEDPDHMIAQDLLRFKERTEAGAPS
jgi:uncharacterized membrane protein